MPTFMSHPRRVITFLATIWLIVGCNQTPPQPDIAPVSLAPLPTMTTSTLPVGSETVLNLAKNDLASRQKVTLDKITLLAIKPVNWPDTSLDCPEEGMMYAQIITPGYLITLTLQSQTFTYHTDQQNTATLCQP